MAGWALGPGEHKQGVVVAVHLHIHQVEKVATLFALDPKTALAAAIECDLACGAGLLHGLGIHIAEHQHRARGGILNDGGNKAAAFFKVYVKIVQGSRFNESTSHK